MPTPKFPVFDLARFETASAGEKLALAAEVDAICRATGFLAIVGHGVPEAVIAAAWAKAQAFFDLPAEQKQRARAPYPGYPYGYLGPQLESLAKSRNVDAPPDLKESFNGGPSRPPEGMTDPEALAFCYAATIWPDAPEGFVGAWQSYYAAMENLAARIMRLFAAALRLPEDYFDRFIDAPISALRALNYPRQDAAPEPGQIRAGAHTDYGSLTILLPQPGSRGLEILTPDGAWTEVPPHPAPSSSTSGISWRAGPTTAGSRRCIASSTPPPRTAAMRAGSRSRSSISRTGTRKSACWRRASPRGGGQIRPRAFRALSHEQIQVDDDVAAPISNHSALEA